VGNVSTYDRFDCIAAVLAFLVKDMIHRGFPRKKRYTDDNIFKISIANIIL